MTSDAWLKTIWLTVSCKTYSLEIEKRVAVWNVSKKELIPYILLLIHLYMAPDEMKNAEI